MTGVGENGYDSRPDTYAHIRRVGELLNGVVANLLVRGERHDDSKLVSPEVEVFDEFTPKLKDSTYGSDEYKSFLAEMGKGLRHHYEENRHHPEHWQRGVRGMSLLDIMEMLCDWKAATERHADGDLRRSIEQNMERFGYPEILRDIFLNTVDEMEWQPSWEAVA